MHFLIFEVRVLGGRWWRFGAVPILIRMRGLCVVGFFMQFLIFEVRVLGGRWWLVDGRWWGLGGAPILVRMRGLCVVGFFMQFLIFEVRVEELQGAAELGA